MAINNRWFSTTSNNLLRTVSTTCSCLADTQLGVLTQLSAKPQIIKTIDRCNNQVRRKSRQCVLIAA